jgi:hypothetical protein
MAYLEFRDIADSRPKSVYYEVPCEGAHGQELVETVMIPSKLIRDQRTVGGLHFVYVPTWFLKKAVLPAMSAKGLKPLVVPTAKLAAMQLAAPRKAAA